MTGLNIYNIVLSLVGEEITPENIEKSIPETVLTTINGVGKDLDKDFHLGSIYDQINKSPEFCTVLTFGMAMFVSAMFGMNEKNIFFTELYNAKRASLKSGSATVKNVIPD